MQLEDQIENQKPYGRNFRQEPEGVKWDLLRLCSDFPKFKVSRPSEALGLVPVLKSASRMLPKKGHRAE